MPSVTIRKIEVTGQKIHIQVGKTTYTFGDIGRLQEMAHRANLKSGTDDAIIQGLCAHLEKTTPLNLTALSNIRNTEVIIP